MIRWCLHFTPMISADGADAATLPFSPYIILMLPFSASAASHAFAEHCRCADILSLLSARRRFHTPPPRRFCCPLIDIFTAPAASFHNIDSSPADISLRHFMFSPIRRFDCRLYFALIRLSPIRHWFRWCHCQIRHYWFHASSFAAFGYFRQRQLSLFIDIFRLPLRHACHYATMYDTLPFFRHAAMPCHAAMLLPALPPAFRHTLFSCHCADYAIIFDYFRFHFFIFDADGCHFLDIADWRRLFSIIFAHFRRFHFRCHYFHYCPPLMPLIERQLMPFLTPPLFAISADTPTPALPPLLPCRWFTLHYFRDYFRHWFQRYATLRRHSLAPP